jgi:anti-sigma factor RsiW
MNCERMETRLLAYMDGRATDAERREVDLHLIACADCRARVEEFRRLWAVLDEAPMTQPSASFDAALRQRIAAVPARPGWASLWSWIPAPRLAFAVSLLLVLSVWISSMPTGPVRNPTELAQHEEEFKMINDLPVLEDYDVLANFEALSELPPKPDQTNGKM